jgi:voltage-gated potassium channel
VSAELAGAEMAKAKIGTLRTKLQRLYHGNDRRAVRFRYALLTFDIGTIAFFIVSSMVPHEAAWFLAVDYAVALVLVVDFAARIVIAERKGRYLLNPIVIADAVVIATLLAPVFMENFAFLRVVRVLRLLRSYHVLKELRQTSAFFKRNEEVIQSVVNLVVFIFFVTALVYVLQVRINPQIKTYVDALYFTVTTLTTTGFGDITLQGSTGRLLAVVIMVFGVALFLRLVQTIFRPQKVTYECQTCGLKRHDPDAVHCKHCGAVVHIDTEGEWG